MKKIFWKMFYSVSEIIEKKSDSHLKKKIWKKNKIKSEKYFYSVSHLKKTSQIIHE